MSMLKEFKEFLLKQNVIALAIAVVVGTALNTLVKAVVDDFIMLMILVVAPGGEWQKMTWNVGAIKFGLGDFLAATINFLIVGFVAWLSATDRLNRERVTAVRTLFAGTVTEAASETDLSVQTKSLVVCALPTRNASAQNRP